MIISEIYYLVLPSTSAQDDAAPAPAEDPAPDPALDPAPARPAAQLLSNVANGVNNAAVKAYCATFWIFGVRC